MINSPSNSAISQLRLWQMISPTLPVGAYAYSQGLETAIDSGWVSDEQGTQDWICGLLRNSLAQLDLPILIRLYGAWNQNDMASLEHWNRFLLASRESAELLAEDQQLGAALHILLSDLGITAAAEWDRQRPSSFAAMFALGASRWHIPLTDVLGGYGWAWCENQVAAAIKLVPLGQTAGQRILSHLIPAISESTALALTLDDDEIGASAPGLGIASALHETQYSRLFRS